MKTTLAERTFYRQKAQELDQMNFPGPKQDGDFLRRIIADADEGQGAQDALTIIAKLITDLTMEEGE